jgi:anaerobic magnesium-protoporphyrin IX monomethyl ester cyclase
MVPKKKVERVLLIQPPLVVHTDLSSEPKGVHPPIGLGYIAAVVEKNYDVRILDSAMEGYHTEVEIGRNRIRYGLTYDQIGERIDDFRPDVIGVSNGFSSGFGEALAVCKLARKINPEILTVLGGPHPSAVPEQVSHYEEVDFVVIGEGEYTFRDLLRGLADGCWTELDGLAWKSNGKVVVQSKTRFIENLDELPWPARHLLPMKKYFDIGEAFLLTKRKPFTPLNTSRGCVAQCTFCPIHATWGGRWRARSAANVLDEIEHLVRAYGVREIHFDDDNLVLNRNRAVALFQGLIDRKLDVVWTVPTGLALWAVDDELLALMKKSGCYKLFVAVESGDEHMLKEVIRKPLDLKKVKPLVRTMQRLGIEVESFFVVGMPGETRESLRKTFRFARQLDTDVSHYFFANPMPGTQLWEMCEQKGYFRGGFSLENVRVEQANIETPEMPAAELEGMVAREEVRGRLTALLRHPLRMSRKYAKYIKKDPRVVLNFALKNIRDSVLIRGGRSSSKVQAAQRKLP